MIRFAVYDNAGPAAVWPLHHAHLVGPDDIPIRGDVSFDRGIIRCQRRGVGAFALALLYDVGPMGRLVLPTCLLPERDNPYLLSLELARHRIKFFIAKSEEWQMFDLSAEHPAMQLWEDARRLFTQAWTTMDEVQADTWARQSLIQAIDASERLAMAHSEILLHRRFGQRAASTSTLGVRLWPQRDAQPLREILKNEFDVINIPLQWSLLEPEEGKQNWDAVDRWMTWAQGIGKPIVAGPLVDFSLRSMPRWMNVWQNDFETCRDLLYDHCERVVQRYAGLVGMWNIAAGLNTNSNFQFNHDQMLDIVRMASLLIKHSRRGARTMIEFEQPFGEHCSSARDSVFPLTFLDRMIQGGVHVDAIGVRMLFGHNAPGLAARDLMQASSMLDRYLPYEKPVLLSAVGVPSVPAPSDPGAGTWHDHWSEDRQAKWMSRMFAVSLSKPYIESFFWCDLYDHESQELPSAGLITSGGKAKLGLQRIIGLRRRLRRPLGELKLPPKSGSPAAALDHK